MQQLDYQFKIRDGLDQPVFGQFNWSEEKKSALQSLAEKIHAEWPIDRNYIPAPTLGKLVGIDDNLIVTPQREWNLALYQ